MPDRASSAAIARHGDQEQADGEAVYDLLADTRPVTALDRRVDRLGRYVGVLFLVAVAISFYEIVMRYAFNAPTIWVHETVIALVAVCYAFGGAFALARDSHIRIGLIRAVAGPRVRKILNVVNAAMALVFAAALGWAAYLMTRKAWISPAGELSLDRSGSAWNPPLPAMIKAGLLVCLVLMGVQALLHLVHWLRDSMGREH
ncbi:TRAP transporter small permease subunit [Ferruginivarius sediminum]|uniref:TRAP transporter small permease protein n=1 Tax=Ferruginivarius sediminum TaxID=2661937 RepID=A0A369T872_9PROT|nr:TRAP transporter small permease [Ferruginivarius sediminum]RDD60654.1 TRAP transporter small permease [Ferruginivarius sediminum]